MRLPRFDANTKVERYNVASLAAITRAMEHPPGMRCVQAVKAYGATMIHVDIESTGKTLTDCAIPGYDMPCETNELVDDSQWTPVNCMLKEGEALGILGSSLTLAAELVLLVQWGRGPIPGIPEMRYSYHTYTAVATGIPAVLAPANLPDFARDLRLAQTRGINLEATNFAVGGIESGWVDGRNCSALNDIIMPAEWQSLDVRGVGNKAVLAKESNVGATGTSDVILGWTV